MAISFNNIRHAYGLDDTLDFGKHQGSAVSDIIKQDPSYIQYLLDETKVRFYQSVRDELKFIKHKVDVAYHMKYARYVDYDTDTLGEWSDWNADVPF